MLHNSHIHTGPGYEANATPDHGPARTLEPVTQHYQQVDGDVLSLKDKESWILSGLFPGYPQPEVHSNT